MKGSATDDGCRSELFSMDEPTEDKAVSFAVMRRRRLMEALAFDLGFTADGFVEVRSNWERALAAGRQITRRSVHGFRRYDS